MSQSDAIEAAYRLGADARRRVCPYDRDLDPHLFEAWCQGFRDRYEAIEVLTKKRGRKKEHDEQIVAAADFETDPFAGEGNHIAPFAAGFYDGSIYVSFWGDDAPEQLVAYIRSLTTPHIIYFHNGGKFDFSFILKHLEPSMFCIGTRIVKAYIVADDGKTVHQVRDSFSIMPVPLKHAANKLEFDYANMAKGKRNKHRKSIETYLRQDCVELHGVVSMYRQTFGDALTMAGAAMRKLNQAMTPDGKGTVYDRLSDRHDQDLRKFYYGGRVQCFERGVIEGDFHVYDITSSYPNCMSKFEHPVGDSYKRGMTEIGPKTDFAIIDATSQGALPIKDEKTGKLEFPNGRHTFFATGHEIRTALELGVLKIHKVIDAMQCSRRMTFEPFIREYWERRQHSKDMLRQAKLLEDVNGIAHWTALDLFWKLVMNSAYGKFAQNPRKFKDTMIVDLNHPPPDDTWQLSERHQNMDVYTRPANPNLQWKGFLNIGTGASITGAARANLLRGIVGSQRVLYCDTDSIICEEFGGGETEGAQLGGWKHEASCDVAAIAGRKMYALFDDGNIPDDKKRDRIAAYGIHTCVKMASKGVRLKAEEVYKVASGGQVLYKPLAPTIKLDGRQIWTPRLVRAT